MESAISTSTATATATNATKNESEKPNHMKNIADLATLTLLTNGMYTKETKGRTSATINGILEGEKRELKKDMRFYRARINDVVKSILRNKQPNSHPISDNVRNAFDKFAKRLIEEFKMADTVDCIQGELDNKRDNKIEHCEDSGSGTGTDTIMVENDDSNKDDIVDQRTIKSLSKIDLGISNYKTKPNTFDTLVTKVKREDNGVDTPKKREMRLMSEAPKPRVNLKDPSLRKKNLSQHTPNHKGESS